MELDILVRQIQDLNHCSALELKKIPKSDRYALGPCQTTAAKRAATQVLKNDRRVINIVILSQAIFDSEIQAIKEGKDGH